MSFYQDRILPHIIHMTMRQDALVPYRQRTASNADGRVLEVGFGSGLNLPFYSSAVTHVIGLDPSGKLLSMSRTLRSASISTNVIEGSAEEIPLDNGSVDTVVTTWTLCTIPDVRRALSEMRRVLRAHGRLAFVEHGRSPDSGVWRWQDRLTPVWKRVGGGCHLNRPIADLIDSAGFRVDGLTTEYAEGPRPMSYLYEGVALRQ